MQLSIFFIGLRVVYLYISYKLLRPRGNNELQEYDNRTLSEKSRKEFLLKS